MARRRVPEPDPGDLATLDVRAWLLEHRWPGLRRLSRPFWAASPPGRALRALVDGGGLVLAGDELPPNVRRPSNTSWLLRPGAHQVEPVEKVATGRYRRSDGVLVDHCGIPTTQGGTVDTQR